LSASKSASWLTLHPRGDPALMGAMIVSNRRAMVPSLPSPVAATCCSIRTGSRLSRQEKYPNAGGKTAASGCGR
jgi:hypothetical protein